MRGSLRVRVWGLGVEVLGVCTAAPSQKRVFGVSVPRVRCSQADGNPLLCITVCVLSLLIVGFATWSLLFCVAKLVAATAPQHPTTET